MIKYHINIIFLGILIAIGIQACKDSSSGPEPEPDPPVELQITSVEPESGYIINIDLQKTLGSSTNDTLLFEDVEQGSRQLGLEDLDNECSVPDANPQDISVVAQDTIQALIEFECEEVVLKNKIVYRHWDGGCEGLFIMDSDGSNPKQLTSYNYDTTDILKINLDGTGLSNITNTPEISETDPNWSPMK